MTTIPLYKECPGCTTYIYPDEGCDSLHCRVCNKHICWVCLGIFPDSNQCHDHLLKVHGGYYSRRK